MTTAEKMQLLVDEYSTTNRSTLEIKAKKYIEQIVIPNITKLAKMGRSQYNLAEDWPNYPKLQTYSDNTFGQQVTRYTDFYEEVRKQLISEPHKFTVVNLLVKW